VSAAVVAHELAAVVRSTDLLAYGSSITLNAAAFDVRGRIAAVEGVLTVVSAVAWFVVTTAACGTGERASAADVRTRRIPAAGGASRPGVRLIVSTTAFSAVGIVAAGRPAGPDAQ
jgi:hypothetical protein